MSCLPRCTRLYQLLQSLLSHLTTCIPPLLNPATPSPTSCQFQIPFLSCSPQVLFRPFPISYISDYYAVILIILSFTVLLPLPIFVPAQLLPLTSHPSISAISWLYPLASLISLSDHLTSPSKTLLLCSSFLLLHLHHVLSLHFFSFQPCHLRTPILPHRPPTNTISPFQLCILSPIFLSFSISLGLCVPQHI